MNAERSSQTMETRHMAAILILCVEDEADIRAARRRQPTAGPVRRAQARQRTRRTVFNAYSSSNSIAGTYNPLNVRFGCAPC